MVAKLRAIKGELSYRKHEPIDSVGAWLRRVVVGYHRYHAIPGNLDQLRVFGYRLQRLWHLVLSRRSQRGLLPWDRVRPIFDRWIPKPRVLHPYPSKRFFAIHPRWEPYA
jgi:RNA-directed DNA polymerase